MVRGTQQLTCCRSCRVGESLKFKRRDNVLGLIVRELVKLIHTDGIKACGNYDSAVLLLNVLVLLLIVDSSSRADLCAKTALTVLKHITSVGVDGRNLRHCLCKGDIDSATVIHTEVELVRHFLHGTLFGTSATACTNVLLDVTRLFLYLNVKVTDKSLYLLYLAEGEDTYLFILRNVNHFRREDTSRTVKCGEGLIKLSHLTADGRILLNDIHLKACVSDVESRLNTRDTAADNERTLGYGRLTWGKRCIKVYLCDSRLTEDYCLFSTREHILMYPRALLSYVCYLNHVGVKTCGGSRLTECRLVHSGGAGAYDDACELMLGNRLLYHVLSCLRAHILIVGGEDHAGLVLQGVRNCLNVNRTCNVTAAPTYKNSNSLHCLSSLLTVLSECADYRLLRKLLVKQRGNVVSGHVVCALLTYSLKTNCLNKLCGFNATGASLDTSKA